MTGVKFNILPESFIFGRSRITPCLSATNFLRESISKSPQRVRAGGVGIMKGNAVFFRGGGGGKTTKHLSESRLLVALSRGHVMVCARCVGAGLDRRLISCSTSGLDNAWRTWWGGRRSRSRRRRRRITLYHYYSLFIFGPGSVLLAFIGTETCSTRKSHVACDFFMRTVTVNVGIYLPKSVFWKFKSEFHPSQVQTQSIIRICIFPRQISQNVALCWEQKLFSLSSSWKNHIHKAKYEQMRLLWRTSFEKLAKCIYLSIT